MTSLDFVQTNSLAAAVVLLNTLGLRCLPIAGRTDLVVAMRQRGPWFNCLVDVTTVPEFLESEESADHFGIGAAVTFARAAAHLRLRAVVAMLIEACLAVDSPQIRYTGTLFDAHLIPTAKDVPDITGILLEKPYSKGPFGAKNVAKPALVPTAPAICNAIAHATGRRVRDLPANLERILLGHELAHADGGLSCKFGLHLG